MRDIKFRAWDNLLNEYFSWEDSIKFLNYHDLIEDNYNGAVSLEQYTGLKDKNGVEIYEGDIVSASIYGFQEKGLVEYSQFGEWVFGDIRLFEFMSSLTVIGNIHENADLLEEK